MIKPNRSKTLAARSRAGWSSALLILSALLALPALVQAQFSFTTNNGAITITGYNPAAGPNMVIPATTNGYPVTSIGDYAFPGSSITSVTIPNSVTSIGVRAFEGCSRLTSVTIGNSVTNIGFEAFEVCSSLTNITVDAANSAYSSLNGVLFDKNQATLLQFPPGLGGSYTIPSSVTTIGNYAFLACTKLISVTFPNSVTGIGNYAFQDCVSLASVTIPNSVTSIGASAFEYCNSLTSVTIPNSVTNIGGEAVAFCSSLTNITVDAANPAYSSLNGVLFDKSQATLLQFPGGLGGSYTIPSSVTSIGVGAFIQDNLGCITIPNSVTNIGETAFGLCYYLSSVTIGNSVTNIGFEAFFSCTNLASVTIPNSVTTIGGAAFSECSRLTSVTLGTNVTSIGGTAFYSCSLTSVTIPNSVTNIGSDAFGACFSLTSANFLGNAPPDDGGAWGAFYNDPATVYYLAGTTGWGSTFGGVPAVLWNPQANTFSFTGGQFGFNLTGPPNVVIVVEACTNLAHPVWLPVSTNTLSGLGTSAFSDPTGYAMRYYRFRSP